METIEDNNSKKILFAAADCTGHGVPGAMVSVVCNNGLNRAVREFGLTDPGKILDKTREIVIQEFEKSEEVYFDIKETYISAVSGGESSKVVLERSIEQHAKICIENSEDVYDALALAKLLDVDIDYRIQVYAKCISRSTFNFLSWLKDDYKKRLTAYLRENFDKVFEEIHGFPPED